MNRIHGSEAHLTTGQVAAILDARFRGPDREPAMAHLAGCAECRREMAELHRALREQRQGSRRTRRWLITASGIAAALVVAVVPAQLERTRAARAAAASTRAAAGLPVDAAAPITIVAPPENAAVAPTTVLTWRSAGPGTSYLVTVQDTSGAVSWSSTLTDTTIALPSSAALVPGQRYFWRVDGRMSDGVSTTTGVRSFIVR